MGTIRVHDILPDRVLVSRESARRLEAALRDGLAAPESVGGGADAAVLVVDFLGVEGVAPSFLDELIRVFEDQIRGANESARVQLKIANPPTRLSQKFEAIARSHALSVRLLSDGAWMLEHAA